MHKEDVIVTPSKPRTPVRTAATKKEEGSVIVNHTIHLHSRLPSTDSGIQADGGFDSLSRYKGKSFLSTCNDQGTTDSVSSTSMHSSASSSGYSSDLSQGSLSQSLSPKVLTLPSQSHVAASKPIPPMKPALTSLSSKSSPPGSIIRSRTATSSNQLSHTPQVNNVPTSTQTKPLSTSSISESSKTSIKISGISNQPGVSEKPVYVNQIVTASKPAMTQRTELSTSVTNRKPDGTVPVNHMIENESINAFPSVKVVAHDNNVKLSISKSAISVSSNPPSSDTFNPSPHHRTSTVLNVDPPVGSTKLIESNSKGSATTIFSAPSSTLKLQVLNPVRQGQAEQDTAKNQGQGCIALTRPLRLGVPSKISIKTLKPTTLSSQPQHLVPVIKPPQQQEQKQHQQTSPAAKPKPKIAPRPSVLAKSAATQSTTMTTNSNAAISASNITSEPLYSNVTSNITTSRTVTSQSGNETLHKTEVPVVHRIKTTPLPAGRTEIPVTHVVHRTHSCKNQNNIRPSSFFRYTPEREKHRHQQEQYTRQPIYENIRFDIREGFDFDDSETRMKHAELIMKHSDELINDALRMLGTSSLDARGSFTSSTKLADESRIVDGGDLSAKREHRIPVFDVRTGTLHGGVKKNFLTEWTDGQLSAPNGESKKEVTWNERKDRIDTALSWLKHELADLRDMDNTLISQFKRCQDTIEALKTQREVWEGLSEEGEEGEYWDDYELNEFNRRYLDSPGGSSSSQFSPGSRELSLQDVTLISFPVPQLNLPPDKKTANGCGVKQDIEATL